MSESEAKIKIKPVIRKKIVLKKKTVSPVLNSFLESHYMMVTPTKAELRKIVNSYIVDNNLQQPNGSRQNINLDDQLKTLSGLTDDSTTIYHLLESIILKAGKLAKAEK